MSEYVIWGIIGAAVILFLYKNKSSSKLSTQDFAARIQKTQEEFEHLDTKTKTSITKEIDELTYIVGLQLKLLPDYVLAMDYTQQAVDAFIFYYTSTVIRPKFSNEKTSYMIMLLTLKKLFNDNVERIAKFSPSAIVKNQEFMPMPQLIGMMAKFPPQQRTALLVFIEKYMEKTTGKKTRFMQS